MSSKYTIIVLPNNDTRTSFMSLMNIQGAVVSSNSTTSHS